MKKIEILRPKHLEDLIERIIEVFKKNGYEITKDQAHALTAEFELYYCSITFSLFKGDWIEVE